ncbi:Phosphorus acquisition-controlling protein [Madurella mycetomatis]|uniref:Phosphorus acquisition-controlling protein n=1 Tax=Madurella mycetomatis TaxID=100816 RepID=A0A175W1J8_9PEZI|nr:Phosphorus acquisition-controlling protein [Madurella mycetomatis]
MHSAAPDNPVYNPTLGGESSFPERHFTTGDSAADWSHQAGIPCLVGAGLDSPRSAAAETLEADLASPWPQDWLSQAQPLLHRNPIPTTSLMLENNLFSAPLQQTAPLGRAEWDWFREKPSGTLFWNPTPPESNIEEDSDSIQSPSDNPEEPSLPLSVWTSAQRPRRRSTHRVGKPSRAPAPKRSNALHAATHLGGYSAPDVDFFDITAIFLDRAHPAAEGPEIDVVFQDSAPSSKVDSKRIAHKLSEKSRRNRLTLAIREIQKLLPASASASVDSAGAREGDLAVRPGVPNSKLDVVEMAVGFIKDLKEKNKEMATKLREAAERSSECRCRLEKGESMAFAAEDDPRAVEM